MTYIYPLSALWPWSGTQWSASADRSSTSRFNLHMLRQLRAPNILLTPRELYWVRNFEFSAFIWICWHIIRKIRLCHPSVEFHNRTRSKSVQLESYGARASIRLLHVRDVHSAEVCIYGCLHALLLVPVHAFANLHTSQNIVPCLRLLFLRLAVESC